MVGDKDCAPCGVCKLAFLIWSHSHASPCSEPGMWLLVKSRCIKRNHSGRDCVGVFLILSFLRHRWLWNYRADFELLTPLFNYYFFFFISAAAAFFFFFVNPRLIGPLVYNGDCDWLRVLCWPKVDSLRDANAGSKNSSSTTAPCASPERVWNNHWELVCAQTLLNYEKSLLFWILDAAFFTFVRLLFLDDQRVFGQRAMTRDNRTGNFI